jgi:hypothetical protein
MEMTTRWVFWGAILPVLLVAALGLGTATPVLPSREARRNTAEKIEAGR